MIFTFTIDKNVIELLRFNKQFLNKHPQWEKDLTKKIVSWWPGLKEYYVHF